MDDFIKKAALLLADRRNTEEIITRESSGPVQAMRWNVASKLESLYWGKVQDAIFQGRIGVDQPIELGFSDTCLLNFGTCPDLLDADLHISVTSGNSVPDNIELSSPQLLRKRRAMGFMEMNYSELHSSSGVYNMEPWLQEMYRDCLDIDHLETLKERSQLLEKDIRSVPARLLSLGIPSSLVTEIMQGLRRFSRVQEASKTKEKHKTSIAEARNFSREMEHINDPIDRAREYAPPPPRSGEPSQLDTIFSCWKEAVFEINEIADTLSKAAGALTGDEENDLSNLIGAVRETLTCCAEDESMPQYSLLYSSEAEAICPRQVIEEELEALQMHDIVENPDMAGERLESRKFGPLCALIAPGRGVVRYSHELREFQMKRLQQNPTPGRGFDLDRRSSYPLNYLVVPNQIPPEAALEQMADAFLDYKSVAFHGAYSTFISEACRHFPVIMEEAQKLSGVKNSRRRIASRYLAGFVRWAKYGRSPDLPDMDRFIDWAKKRLRRPQFLVQPRYRCVMEDFAEATPTRRNHIYQHHQRDRYTVDRMKLCLAIIKEDVEEVLSAARFLPAEERSSRYFKRAVKFYKSEDPLDRSRAIEQLRAFAFSNSELKRIFLATEAEFSGEVDMIRTRALESLGRDLSYEEAAASIFRRKGAMLAERLEEANVKIDRDLLALLYCAEKNYTAAGDELTEYIQRLEEQRYKRGQTKQFYDGSGLRDTLGNRASRRRDTTDRIQRASTRVVGALRHAIIFEDDFAYYNLGSLALKTGDTRKASDCFSRFCLWAAQENWHLFGEYAKEINHELEKSFKK